MDELQQVQAEIAELKTKFAEVEEKGDRDLVLMYGNMLGTKMEKENLLLKKTLLSDGTSNSLNHPHQQQQSAGN